MKIIGLLSWFDERPDWLAELVASLAPVCDELVALDGAYAAYPGEGRSSPAEYAAIRDTAREYGLPAWVYGPAWWSGGEVEKRAALFSIASLIARRSDWFLVIDGDEYVRSASPEGLRKALCGTEMDVAEVTFGHRRNPPEDEPLRMLFRALPGLTVRHAHYAYTAEGRWLWATPMHLRDELGEMPEPALDVTEHLAVQHRLDDRPPSRVAAQQTYYTHRERAGIERNA